jgi:hypothetical protein
MQSVKEKINTDIEILKELIWNEQLSIPSKYLKSLVNREEQVENRVSKQKTK